MSRRRTLPPELAAIAPEWPCSHVPHWQVGFGAERTWWSYCSLRAPSRRSALARARREVAVLWQVLNLHKGGDIPSLPDTSLALIEGFPVEEDWGQAVGVLCEGTLRAAGYATLADPRHHPWDAAHAREAVRAILRRTAAIPGALAMGSQILIRHNGNATDADRLPIASIRCEIEVQRDGDLHGLPLPHAMRTALAACAAAALATNPDMNVQGIGAWPEDGIDIPRSASARAVLQDDLAASARHDEAIVTDLLRQLRLETEADAFLHCLGRLP